MWFIWLAVAWIGISLVLSLIDSPPGRRRRQGLERIRQGAYGVASSSLATSPQPASNWITSVALASDQAGGYYDER